MIKRLLLFALAITTMAFVTAPQTQAEPLVAITFNNVLVRFDSDTPGTISTVPITGLMGDTLFGIDYRPSNGVLYGISIAPAFVSRLYTINPVTGAATFVARLSPGPNNELGSDFNPVADTQGLTSLRVVTQNEQNFRVNADTGETIEDGNINGVPSTAQIIGVAYTNNFLGATSTTLYGIDATSNQLFRFTDPNAGTVVSVGALGVDIGFNFIDFDISGSTGVAYAALRTEVTQTLPFSSLYTINLATGQASLVGLIGPEAPNGFPLRGLTVMPGNPIPEPTTMLLLSTGLAGIAAKVRRRNKK